MLPVTGISGELNHVPVIHARGHNATIERFDPLGEKFDPTQHEAMFEVPDDEKESGIVAHIVEPGYKISDRVLRPARVGVSKSNTKKNG